MNIPRVIRHLIDSVAALPFFRFRRLIAVMLALAGVLSAHAASNALIIVGLTANETDAQLWQRLADQSRTGLLARGFAPENIALLTSTANQPVTRDNVLAAFAKARAATGKDDACWVLLLGHSAPGRDELPAFQLRGPRLTTSDLHDALAGFTCPTYILLGTEFSSDYLPSLKTLPNCNAVAASAGPMVPRFPEYWVAALAADPKATFAELAADAADKVVAYYKKESLAQSENAGLLAAQMIQQAPFAKDDNASPTTLANTPSPSDAATSIEGNDFPPSPAPDNNKDFTIESATDQSRLLLAAAKELADKAGDSSAVILHQEMDLTFNADRSSSESMLLRIYLRKPEAVEKWADFDFEHEPPAIVTVIENARVIQPDGSIVVVNPDRIAGAHAPGESELPLPFRVHLPQVTAGAIIEIAWRVEHHADNEMPETYAELPIAHDIPVADTVLTLRTPRNIPIFHQFRQLPNAPAAVETATEHSQVLTWHLAALPAWEPLPNDPPARDLEPMIAISSFASWDEFTAWVHRITQGSFEAGPATRAAAAEIAKTHTTPADRLKAAYEEVSSLRYVAIELGIHGFRPRSPDTVLANRYGDCKDKATLLAALLRELGISAEFCLLNRESSTDPTFPGWEFNHALVHVPANAGLPEQWLDATDGTTPPGFIAPGDMGRSALVFSGDKASFLTITSLGQATTISDTWTLSQQADGSWQGQLVRKVTGLADEDLREELRPMSPAQRADWLETQFAGLSADAEFSRPTISDLSNIGTPITVNIEVTCPTLPQSSSALRPFTFVPALAPGFNLVREVAAPERDRPFLVNDGQPVHYEQQIDFKFIHPVVMPATETKTSDPHATGNITYTRPDAQTVRRSATLDVTVPMVPAADYTAFRRAILEWRRALANSISIPNS